MRTKKPKLTPIPKIHKQLYLLCAKLNKEESDYTCQLCGLKKGDTKPNGKPVILNSHHLINRHCSDFLKFHPRNHICLCTSCHKYDLNCSAHKASMEFYHWYSNQFKDNFEWLLQNKNVKINLRDRDTLQLIDKELKTELQKELKSEIPKKI